MATVKIHRPWAYFGFVRKLKVWIDDVHVGSIQSKKSQTFELDSGTHVIRVSMDWCKSKPLEISDKNNEEIRVTVKTVFWLYAMAMVFFKPLGVFQVLQEESI